MTKRLNEKQYAAIEYLALPKRGGKTYEQIAEEVGVTRRTLQAWRNDDLFNDTLKNKVVKNTIDRLPEVMESIPDHIIDNENAAMLRTFLQAHGLLTEKSEVTTKDSRSHEEHMGEMRAELDRLTDNGAIDRFKERKKNE